MDPLQCPQDILLGRQNNVRVCYYPFWTQGFQCLDDPADPLGGVRVTETGHMPFTIGVGKQSNLGHAETP